MDVLAPLLIFLLLLAVVAVVSAPLRGGEQRIAEADEERRALREELEAAKEAKYKEIRDADLDRRTGKLSDEDFHTVDRELRTEAVELLRRLDELGD